MGQPPLFLDVNFFALEFFVLDYYNSLLWTIHDTEKCAE